MEIHGEHMGHVFEAVVAAIDRPQDAVDAEAVLHNPAAHSHHDEGHQLPTLFICGTTHLFSLPLTPEWSSLPPLQQAQPSADPANQHGRALPGLLGATAGRDHQLPFNTVDKPPINDCFNTALLQQTANSRTKIVLECTNPL